MASIEDVARLAKVSPSTASRVVRNQAHVRPEVRERVMSAVAELNYVPNAMARALKGARSNLIALITTDIQSPFFAQVASGAEETARKAGLTILLGNTEEDIRLEQAYLRIMSERRVDGVILVPSGEASPAVPRGTETCRYPIVFLDRPPLRIQGDAVRCDTGRGARRLCEHLLSLGHRRIAIVGGKADVATWHERIAGVRAALAAAGFDLPEEMVIPGDYKGPSGAAAVRQLAERNRLPDVIIAANAQVSIGVLNELSARNIRVPQDIGVAAIDDPMPSASFWPRLTVVEQPGRAMGRQAVELLQDRLNNAGGPFRHITFEAELRIGSSCGEQLKRPKHAQARSMTNNVANTRHDPSREEHDQA